MKLFRKILSLALVFLLVSGIVSPAGITAAAAGPNDRPAVLEDISINTPPDKTEYYIGQTLNLDGLKLKLHYTRGQNEIVSADQFEEKGISASPADGTALTTEGKNKITLTLGEHTTSFEVTVNPVEVSGLTVNTLPTVTEYSLGQKLDLTGLTAKLHYSDGSSNIISAADFADKGITVTPADGTELTTEGKNKITVALGKHIESFEITVSPVTVSDLTVNTLPTVTEYSLGQKLDLTGLTAKLHYSDGSSNIISAADFADKDITVTPANGTVLTTEGKNKITLALGEHSASFEITVNPIVVSDITVNTLPVKTEYIAGEKLDLTGLTAKLHYSDGGSNIFAPSDFDDKDIYVTPEEGQILTVEGKNTVVVAYAAPDGTKLTASFEINVAPVQSSDRLIDRIFGTTRYETALAISNAGWSKAETVIIASGESFADALAGTTLSHALDAPILLAGKSDNETLLKEIDRLGASKAYILGGENAVSSDVEQMISDAGITVDRLNGKDRYETAVAIAEELKAIGINSDMAIIVSGESFADALSAGFAAAQKSAPILYTNTAELNRSTSDYIAERAFEKMIIIGGEAAVSANTAEQLDKLADIHRIGGEDRYLTSLAVAREFFNPSANSEMAVATGKNFPDALTGGALAVSRGTPVLLVGDSASEQLLAYLDECGTEKVTIFGGENAVSAEIADSLK